MRNIRKAIDIAKVKKQDYKVWVQKMLMVVRATPSKATKVSPHFAVTGRQMDPGILDTKFPLDQPSGLSKQRRQEIQDNIEASKKQAREKENKRKTGFTYTSNPAMRYSYAWDRRNFRKKSIMK